MGSLRDSIRGTTEDVERLQRRLEGVGEFLHGLRSSSVGTGGGGGGGRFLAVPFQPGRNRGIGGEVTPGANGGSGQDLARAVGEGNRSVVQALDSGFRSIRQAISGAPDAAFELRRRGGL